MQEYCKLEQQLCCGLGHWRSTWHQVFCATKEENDMIMDVVQPLDLGRNGVLLCIRLLAVFTSDIEADVLDELDGPLEPIC
jgi:hypothetical protein